jgi:hypothetical protein
LPREIASIALPDVAGRIDHLALDVAGSRLFVAALASGSVEVIDLVRGVRVARIPGLREPQGVLFAASLQKLLVSEGEGARVTIFRGSDLARGGAVALREDPDNLRAETGERRIWVGEGEAGSGALAAIDPASAKVVAEVALDGHPESFALEVPGSRIFVNVPRRREVAVVDRERLEVVARWRLPCAENFPMALDSERRRLFVGCRRPAKLLVLDTATGGELAELDAPADADDIFLDPARSRVYVSAGQGVVRVYADDPSGGLDGVGDLPTGAGARTSLLAREQQRLYVAVPARGVEPARLVVFDTAR